MVPNLIGGRMINVVNTGEYSIWNGGRQGQSPNDSDDLGCPTKPRHGVGIKWMANGQIPKEDPLFLDRYPNNCE